MGRINRGMSEDGETITIKKLHEFPEKSSDGVDKKDIGHLLVLDVETTGTNCSRDKITELGMGIVSFNKKSGVMYKMVREFSEYSDPGIPISEFITNLTGITDEMVKGQKLDYELVNKFFNFCDVVVAHNAQFDRSFIESIPEVMDSSSKKIWCCSQKQIDWKKEGYEKIHQYGISADNGFFVESHRAFNDVLALATNLSFNAENGKTFLHGMLQEAKKQCSEFFAFNSDYKHKDFLKENGFEWNDSEMLSRKGIASSKGVWVKLAAKEEEEELKELLDKEMGSGYWDKNVKEVVIPRNRRFV